MKKIIATTFVSFFMMSLTSCFLFQTHQDCPAYGINKVKQLEKKMTTADTELDTKNSNV